MKRTQFLAAAIAAALCPVARAEDAAAPGPMTERQIERMNKRNRREAQEAWARDKKEFRREEFAQLEADYQEINDKFRDPDITGVIERFLEKYKTGNRVGCATMYLAQKSRGREREKWLKKAIEEFSDCYYLNGCSVGGLARLYLAGHYQQAGDKREAGRLADEIRKDYPKAQDHKGKPIVEMLEELGK